MPDELEPLDPEPVDLEPVDLEPAENGARRDRGQDRRSAWVSPARIWIALVGAGLAAWAVVALTDGGTHARPTTTPATAPAPATTAAPAVPVNRITSDAPALRAALHRVGADRFAAVVDDRLFVVDANESRVTLVALPDGHPTIDDQNGRSLLVSTFAQTLVSTRPIGTRTISARDFAIRADDPEQWWLIGNDGTIRGDHSAARRGLPTGLRPVAAVADGFVALDAQSSWVVWSQSAIRPIARTGAQLVASAAHAVVFKSNCAYGGCVLDVFDLARGTVTGTRLSWIPQFAAFSPDGARLALASTTGDVFIVDPKTGFVIAQTRGRIMPSPSSPFSWTPDGGALLVVQPGAVEIRRASDGRVTNRVRGLAGLEQIVALP
jgi:hypothetical protein